jgi:ACS family hexuronate transporter-like MFS transporter
MVPGALGFLWILAWRWLYHPPDVHPRIGKEELQLITADRQDGGLQPRPAVRPRWRDLLRLPQTWGTIIAKASTDPVWFFVTDWFPIFLVAKGIELRSGLIAVWVPFIAADVGNFFSGAMSGYLIRRGWSLGAARKALIIFGGIGVTLLIPTIFTTNLHVLAFLFGVATFSYACFSTMANVLPADLYHDDAVASVSGLSGTGAGIGTIFAFKLIGYFSDARQSTMTHAFDPIVIVAGLVPFLGMVLVLLLVRNTKATDQGWVRRI